MKKSKIITLLIAVSFFVVVLSLFIFGQIVNNERNSDLTVPSIEKTLSKPLIENKDKIGGNKDDLTSFSIWPDSKVSGIVSYRGSIKGAYFFEGNILINILDSDKKVLKSSNAVSTSDWMTSDPVDFEGNIDFTNLKKGSAYFEIHNDNPSGLAKNDKFILIPIVIE